jgi:uncharacterized membrane protein
MKWLIFVVMKEVVLAKINEFKELAKAHKNVLADQKYSESGKAEMKETALSRVIKTQEAADLFMKHLRALG